MSSLPSDESNDSDPSARNFAAIEPIQLAANAKVGPRVLPARSIPVPTTVSSELQAMIADPYRPRVWNANPKTAAEWRHFVRELAAENGVLQEGFRKRLGVAIEAITISGVNVFVLSPKEIPPDNRNRLLVHFHGGGYVFNPGEAGTKEATLMAAYGGYRVLSVDYRMPPDHPYPAAMDDAMAVWKQMTTAHDPRNMAIFGTSAGGAITLALIQRAMCENVALPAAIAPGSPWADLTETGDTFKTNEWLDNVLVSYNGYLSHAATLYANGRDLKDPQLSPIYGDFAGFPPAILSSGTRDLLLSLTVLTHRKLRRAGVVAELHVFEGMSHAQHQYNPFTPETREAFAEIARFFDAHLGK